MRGQARRDDDLVGVGALEVLDVARVVDLGHGAPAGSDRLDGHEGQDGAHVGVVRAVVRKDDDRGSLIDARPMKVGRVGRIAAHEVRAVPGRVLLDVRQHHDLGLVLVAVQLGDQVACRAVPAAHDDVVAISGCTQTLALLQKEVDDGGDEGPGDRPEHRDAEEDEEPADDAPAGRSDEARLALTEDRGEAPVERIPERADGDRPLEERDEDRGDRHHGHDPLEQREEEPSIELTAEAFYMPRDAPDDRAREQGDIERAHRVDRATRERPSPAQPAIRSRVDAIGRAPIPWRRCSPREQFGARGPLSARSESTPAHEPSSCAVSGPWTGRSVAFVRLIARCADKPGARPALMRWSARPADSGSPSCAGSLAERTTRATRGTRRPGASR